MHLIVFAHKGIAHHCSFTTSAAVATGAGNTLGNKGAVAIFLKFGTTRLLVANAHLAAHQHAEEQRNSDYSKISRTLPVLLDKKETQHAVSSRPRVPWGGEAPPGAKSDESSSSSSYRPASNRLNGSANLTLLKGELSSEVSAGNVTPPSGANHSSNNDLAALRASSQPNLLSEENDSLSSDEDGDYSNTNTITNATAAAVSRQGPPQRPQQNRDNSSDLGSEVSAASSSAMTAAMLDESKVGRGGGRASLSFAGRPGGAGDERSLDQCADAVIFMGDLNYRIKGNRSFIIHRLACVYVRMYVCMYVCMLTTHSSPIEPL